MSFSSHVSYVRGGATPTSACAKHPARRRPFTSAVDSRPVPPTRERMTTEYHAGIERWSEK